MRKQMIKKVNLVILALTFVMLASLILGFAFTGSASQTTLNIADTSAVADIGNEVGVDAVANMATVASVASATTADLDTIGWELWGGYKLNIGNKKMYYNGSQILQSQSINILRRKSDSAVALLYGLSMNDVFFPLTAKNIKLFSSPTGNPSAAQITSNGASILVVSPTSINDIKKENGLIYWEYGGERMYLGKDGLTTDPGGATPTVKEVAKPSVNTNFTYDGYGKNLSVPSNAGYTISGTTQAYQVGNYSATLTLNSGYKWSDGSTSTYQINWRINKANQTPSISTSSLNEYGKATTLSASGGYGTATWRIASGNATIDSSTGVLTPTGVGAVRVQVSFAGDASHEASSVIYRDLNIAQAKFPTVGTIWADSYSDIDRPLPKDYLGGIAESEFVAVWKYTPNIGAVINPYTSTTYRNAGTYSLTVTSKNINYTSGSSSTDFVVEKANQGSIGIFSPSSYTYSATTPYTLSARGGSGSGAVCYQIESGSVGNGTITGNQLVLTKKGEIKLTVVKQADNNYNQVSSMPFSLTANGAAQAAFSAVSDDDNKFWGEEFKITSSGGTGNGAVTYSIVDNGGGVASGINATSGVVAIAKKGSFVVRATKAGNDLYNEISDEITLNVKAISVTYKYSLNGLGGSDKTKDYQYTNTNVSLEAITRTGWISLGWNTTQNATSGMQSTTLPKQERITYYPITSTQVFVYYYNLSVSGKQTASATIYNSATSGQVSLPAMNNATENFVKLGWSKSAAANNNIFDNNAVAHNVTVTVAEKAITLYACYQRVWTVQYDTTTNGGSGNYANSTGMEYYNVADSATPNRTFPTISLSSALGSKADGWNCIGWNTDSNAKSALTAIEITINKANASKTNQNVTAFAIYKKDLEVKLFSTSDSTAQMTYAYTMWNKEVSHDFTLQTPQATEGSGWSALGWRTDRNATTAEVDQTAVVSLSCNKNYYAVYSRQLTLDYNVNGGSSLAPTGFLEKQYKNVLNVSTQGEVKLADALLHRTHVFNAWAENSATGTTHGAGTTFTFGDKGANAVTMFATWTIAQAELNGKLYVSFLDAVAIANNLETVYALIDINFDKTLDIAKNFTIEGKNNAKISRATGTDINLLNITTGSLTLKNITLAGSSCTKSLIAISGGALTLQSGAVLCDNTVTKGNGGAISIANATVTIDGGAIINCKAENGGAIYVAQTATLNLLNGEINNSIATINGGAIFNDGGKVEISGGSISYNQANFNNGAKISTNTNQGNGGAIYNNGTLKINGGSINNNKANGFGAIYSKTAMTLGGTAKIESNQVDGGTTGGGSGLFVEDNLTLDADDANFRLFGEITIDFNKFVSQEYTLVDNGSGATTLKQYKALKRINITGVPNAKLTATAYKPLDISNHYKTEDIVVSEIAGATSAELKAKFSLSNVGMTFDPSSAVVAPTVGGLGLITTNMYCAASLDSSGTAKFYVSITDAIKNSSDGNIYLIATYNETNGKYTTAFGDYSNGLQIEIYYPIEIQNYAANLGVTNFTFKSGLRYVDDVLGDGNTSNQIFLVGADGKQVGGNNGKDVNSNLIGKTKLYRSTSRFDQFFDVHSGVSFNLENIVLDGGAKWDSGYSVNNGVHSTHPLIVVQNGGTLLLGSGATLTNNENTTTNLDGANYGGAVLVEAGGTMIMTAGSVVSNCYARDGGAIINAGTLTINAGEISNCKSSLLGGAVVNTGAFTLGGGTINGSVVVDGIFNLNAGTIGGATKLQSGCKIATSTPNSNSYNVELVGAWKLNDIIVEGNNGTFTVLNLPSDKWAYKLATSTILGGMLIKETLFQTVDNVTKVTVKGDFSGDKTPNVFTVDVGGVPTTITLNTDNTFSATTIAGVLSGKQTVTMRYTVDGSKVVTSKMIITVPEIDTGGAKTGKVEYKKDATDKIFYKQATENGAWVLFDGSNNIDGKKELNNDAYIDADGYAHFKLEEYENGKLTGVYPYKVYVGLRAVIGGGTDPGILPDPTKITKTDKTITIPTLVGYEYLLIDKLTGKYVDWQTAVSGGVTVNDWFDGTGENITLFGLNEGTEYSILARKIGDKDKLPGKVIEPSVDITTKTTIQENKDKAKEEIDKEVDKAVKAINELKNLKADPDEAKIAIDKIKDKAVDAKAKIDALVDPGTDIGVIINIKNIVIGEIIKVKDETVQVDKDNLAKAKDDAKREIDNKATIEKENIKKLVNLTDPEKDVYIKNIDNIAVIEKGKIDKVTKVVDIPAIKDLAIKSIGEEKDKAVAKDLLNAKTNAKDEIDKEVDKAVKAIKELKNLKADPDEAKLAIDKLTEKAVVAKAEIDALVNPTTDIAVIINIKDTVIGEIRKDKVDAVTLDSGNLAKAKDDAKREIDNKAKLEKDYINKLVNLTADEKLVYVKAIDDIAEVKKGKIDIVTTVAEIPAIKDFAIKSIGEEKDKAVAQDLLNAKTKAKADLDEFAKKYLPDGEFGNQYKADEIANVVKAGKDAIDKAKNLVEVAEKLELGKQSIIDVVPLAPTAEVDYLDMKITKLLPNTEYNIVVGEKKYTLTTDADGKIEAAGKFGETSYNFIGKKLEITKAKTAEQAESKVQNLSIEQYWKLVVNFNNQGEANMVLYVRDGMTSPLIANPVKAGFSFKAWFKNAENTAEWNFKYDRVFEDTTLYAGWVDNGATGEKVVITFKTDGAPDDVLMFAKNAVLAEPTVPKKDNMAFEGWYTNADRTNKYIFGKNISADLTLYSKFVRSTVNITLPSGEVLTIDYGAKLDKPTSPQKDGYFFVGWYTDDACSKPLIFDGNATKDGIVYDMTLYAKWVQEVFNVNGKIVDTDGNPISGVTITVDASPNKYVVCTDDNGVYNIEGVANGTYRLIATYQKGVKQTSITEVIKIDGANIVVSDIKLRGDGLNSTVEIGSDAPDAVVGGLNNIFEDNKFISAAEKDTAKKDGNKIEIKFVINKIEMEQKFVDFANQNKKDVALHLDLSLFKILTVDGKEFTSYLSSVDTLLQVIIPLSSELQGKKNYVIYRLHNEEMQEIKMGEANKNEAGEYLEMSNDGKSIILFTKNFSDYAIAFDQPFDYIWVIVDSVLGAILLLAILFAVFKNRKNKDDKKDNNKNGTENISGERAENQNLDSQDTNSKNNSQNAESGVESVKSKQSTPSSVKLNSFVLPSVFLAAITVIPTVGPVLCGLFSAGIAATVVSVAVKAIKQKQQNKLAQNISCDLDLQPNRVDIKSKDVDIKPNFVDIKSNAGSDVTSLRFIEQDENDDNIKAYKFNAATGKTVLVSYRKSFLAKYIQSPADPIQDYYTELKNYILSYDKIKSRISWNFDSFNFGRNFLAKLSVRGKTLILYLALDPAEYVDSKIVFDDESKVKIYENVPFKIKVKNLKRLSQSKELIDAVAAKFGLKKVEGKAVDYHKPYEAFEQLLQEGLIKEINGADVDDDAKVYTSFSFATKNNIATGNSVSTNSGQNLQNNAYELDDIVVDMKNIDIDKNLKSLGGKKTFINVDTIDLYFEKGETVTIEKLYEKKLISKKFGQLKVLARGVLTKPLTVIAEEFSPDAAKMILLVGGNIKLRK